MQRWFESLRALRRFDRRVIQVALLLVLLTPDPAAADGKVFPPKAYPANVRMPDQAALLVWSNGIERLVIETRFEGEGTNFAWVTPLPSEPVIEPATTGLFATLRYLLQPEVKNEVDPVWAAALFCGGLGWLLLTVRKCEAGWPADLADLIGSLATGVGACVLGGAVFGGKTLGLIAGLSAFGATYFAVRAFRCGTQPIYVILISFFLVAVAGGVLLPSLAKTKGAADLGETKGIEILAHSQVGVFETTTVAAPDPAALPEWLEENGFVLTPGSAAVIEQYAKNGWVFVAAKVHRDTSRKSLSTPHPLSFTFPTEAPIYPMRLTGVGADEVLVELYVFGPQRAAAAGFTVEECHRPEWPILEQWWAPKGLAVRHPILRKWASEASVATKLVGRLSRSEMQRDAIISWTPFVSKNSRVYSSRGALLTALNVGVTVTVACTLLCGLRCCIRRRPVSSVARLLLWVAGLGAILTSVAFVCLPRVKVRLEKHPIGQSQHALYTLPYEIEFGLAANPPFTIAEVRTAFHRLPRTVLEDKYRNPFLGGSIREEDSPGNFTLRATDDGVEFIGHDALGGEKVMYVFQH